MSEREELLTKITFIVLGTISALILIIGLILIALGYNEAFYVDNPGVQAFFGLITQAGGSTIYILMVSISYFIYDKKFAKNFGFIILSSACVNLSLKELFQDPRPSTNESKGDERGYVEEGYGFPSGHSQLSVDGYGYIAYEFKDKTEPSFIIPMIFSGFIFLVAISRIIIGVHDLNDIVGGLLIGIGFIIAFIYLEPIVSEKVGSLTLIQKILLSLVFPIVLVILLLAFYPEGEDFAMFSGMILGLSIGYILEGEYVKYEPKDIEIKYKILNLIIGVLLLLISLIIFETVLEDDIIGTFITYSIVAIIIFFVAPLIFTKINKS